MGKIAIYRSAFDEKPSETVSAEGKLLDWLINNVSGFDPLSSWQPFTVLVNGVLVEQRYWPVTRIKSGDIVEWRAMPQDPVSWTVATWIMVASAAISVGSLIYAMSMKKGVSSGSSASAQGSAITSASATANQPKLFGVVRELFVFPTPVGVFPYDQLIDVFGFSLPHARGGVSHVQPSQISDH